MTPEEARDILRTEQIGDGERMELAKQMGALALEKQAPKKPMHEGLAERLCPVCRAHIPFDALNDDASEAPSYCDCCGQAFDWEDFRWAI